MKNFIIFFSLLFMAFSNPLWSAELDTLWVSDKYCEIRFQHPISKNIVIEEFNKLIELESKTGNTIREIPFQTNWDNPPNISNNGSKILHSNFNSTIIFNFPSMEQIIIIDSSIKAKYLNDYEVVYSHSDSLLLVKYNLNTKEKQLFKPEGNIQDIATSLDGRFIAISINYIDVWQYERSKLLLIDSKTMTVIRILEEVMNTKSTFIGLNFSTDGKFLTYTSQNYNEYVQRNIFNTETFQIVKNYSVYNLMTQFLDISFLNDKYYIINEGNYINSYLIYKTKIVDIYTDIILFSIENTNDVLYYSDLNYIYFRDSNTFKTICLNISNLITGVTPSQPTEIVKYQNKQLTIYKENVRQIEISDISGRIILNKAIDNPISNNLILPLNLVNGSYLINVITDKDSFTHKLMVME